MMRRLVERHRRHPAARYRREHLARHHRDVHLCAGAVQGACRHVGGRRGDARQRALSFRLHGAVRHAHRRGRRRRRGRGLAGRSRPRAGAMRSPAHRRGGPRSKAMRRKSSRGCRSSSAPIIRPALPVFAIARPHPDAIVTDVEMWSIKVAGWSAKPAQALAALDRRRCGAGPRVRRRGPAGRGAAHD